MTMGIGDDRPLDLDRPAASLPIDHQHLSDFAMGDRRLEQRFLHLFLEHAPIDMQRMPGATLQEFQRAAHSLRSSASSVGAWRVVERADRILEADDQVAYASRAELLDGLSRSVEQTLAYVRQFLGHE